MRSLMTRLRSGARIVAAALNRRGEALELLLGYGLIVAAAALVHTALGLFVAGAGIIGGVFVRRWGA